MAHPPHPSRPTIRPDRADLNDPYDAADPQEVLAGLRPLPVGSPVVRLREIVSQVRSSPGRSAVIVALVVVGMGVAWWFLRPPSAPVESSLPLAGTTTPSAATGSAGMDGSATSPPDGFGSTTSPSAAAELVVQAAGAVVRGGVYRLPAGSRVDDLVRAAGGLSTDADVDRVNLAAPLGDGERVRVPRAGEQEVPDVVAGVGGEPATAGAPGAGVSPEAPGAPVMVNLNTASAAELDTLRGVGPATAAAILAYREEHGRFGSVDELLDVRGIGEAKLEQLRPSVTV